MLGGKRHSNRSGNALAERAGGHVNARGVVHIGVALQTAANMTERLELLLAEEPALGKHGVEGGGAVALGKHKAIAIGATRIRWVDIHLRIVEISHDVGRAKRSARVSRLGRMNRRHDTLPDLVGNLRQLLIGHGDFLS